MSEKNGAPANKKSHNIVILGLPRSGKSTLLASILQAILTKEGLILHYDLSDNNGINYLKEIWQNALVKGSFPPGESQLRNVTVNIGVESIYEKIKHAFKFLEVSGYIISSIAQNVLRKEDELSFIDSMHKADLAILVVGADTAPEDDMLVSIFFQALKKYDITLPLLLVISMWDKLIQKPENVTEFVKARMPSVFKWLKYGNFPKTEIFKFSVGEVLTFKQFFFKINQWDTSDSDVIFEWIWDYFNKPENNGEKRNGLEKELKSKLSRLSGEPENIDLLREIKDYYLILGEKQKSDEVGRQLKGLIEKKEYEYNLGKRIVLQQVELHDLDFFGNFKWKFQPGVNVLLGRNGYGKSHLLRLLATLLQKNEAISPEYFKYSKTEPFTKLVVEREDKPETIYRNRLVFEEGIGRVPLLAIPDMRSLDRSKTSVSVGISEYDRDRDLSQQWASHFLYQRPIEGLIQDFLYQLCITYLDKGKTFDLPIFKLIHNIVGKLSGQPFFFQKIEPTGQAWFKIEVITEGNENPIPIQKASQGTLSILAIFGLVYSYLKSIFAGVKEEDLTNKPAIVFIDEIDAHLHPSWQQKIIGLLRENFPNVQFIVTAHSPLVVAGCKEGEVAVMKKAAGGFVVESFEQDFIGHEAGELFAKVFEIEEKDDSYLYYNALYPFREEIEEEIKQLEKEKKEKGGSFSKEKEKRLNRLYDDLYYSKRANEKFEKRMEYSNILMENRKLKAKIKKLENRNQAVK